MYCPRCARCNPPETLRCSCGQVLPLARSLEPLFWGPDPERFGHNLRRRSMRAGAIGAVLGASVAFVIMLLAMPLVVFVCLLLTCGVGSGFINWHKAMPWLLIAGVAIGGFLGCRKALHEQE